MWSQDEILEATSGAVAFQGPNSFEGVSIDSRTIETGELFIALKGDRFDGHKFVMNALKRGSGALVHDLSNIDRNELAGKTVLTVPETLQALQDMARNRRRRFSGPVVAVVGSNGKTTTKELIVSILSLHLRVLKTTGNLNNQIGMPLCIVRGNADSQVMVLELGTNQPGEVRDLCAIGQPNVSVITNIGWEHLEGFGSLKGVRDGELEVLPFVGRVIVNADDAFLMEGIRVSFRGEVISFGIGRSDVTMTARDIVFTPGGTQLTLQAGTDTVRVQSNLHGRFNVANVLAAASTAQALGLSLEEIRVGIEAFKGQAMRFEMRRLGGVTVLYDVYNANPSSMEASISEMERLMTTRTYTRAVVVLGDMLELGAFAEGSHRRLGQRLSAMSVDLFIGVGPMMALAVSEFRGEGLTAVNSREACLKLWPRIKDGDLVLVKGSRGMKMERVLEEVAGGVAEVLPANH